MNVDFTSDHFVLHRVAEGAYAAIAKEGGAAYSNAGIIDLGGRTLVLDTFDTPKAAEDLRKAADQITDQPTDLVVISHAHDDHWMGNQVFGNNADILSTHATREAMIQSGHGILELKDDPSELEEMLQERQEELAAEADEGARTLLEASITRLADHIEMLSTFQPRYPNLTFESHMVLHGSKRSAELITKGAGHTSSDCYIVLQDDRLMFMGDLGFFDTQPFTAYAQPMAWVAQLEEMEKMDIETFVPGHGPVGGKGDLASQKEYINLLEKVVSDLIDRGGTVEEAIEISLPELFATWQAKGKARFEANVRATYNRLAGG